ncbi:hypothetical protein A8V01_14620 [Novosphingobium guangzhouense]|uniref:Uncharacterized protein n=2 Tax=Novosphingobium guangzhouense TaxID=1850347 RepID=A0A2K2G477_9SPHN|nr:hypothetical protein A8V01_14620 [Novosphingobium guangzhouense]
MPAGLLERCDTRDIELVQTGDIVTSRNLNKKNLKECAEKVDAIRAHDARARQVNGASPNH